MLKSNWNGSLALGLALALSAGVWCEAAPFNAAGHWVGTDYAGAGTWNNRHAAFEDATPVPIGGNFNTTPSTGVSINGHGSVFFSADPDLNNGGAFGVAGTVSPTAGGTNPTAGARSITFSAVFQTRGGVGGRGGNHWQNSGLIGNERPGGGRGDWGLTYQGSNGQGFQADTEIAQVGGSFNNNLPHIITYSIANPAAANTATLWVDGQLVATGNANYLQADINRTLDTGTNSNFGIGVSTGINCCSGGDRGFIHGDLAEARIDSFLAPSTGASVNLSAAEIVVLHNHASGKYNIALQGNDLYAGKTPGNGDYDHGVTGIVGISGTKLSSSSDSWLTSFNSSGLTINELGGSIADNEGVFAGHNQLIGSILPSATVITDGGFDRADRVWFVQETGAVDFSLTFDLSDLGITLPGAPELLFADTNALLFGSLGILPTVVGDQYTFDLTAFDFNGGSSGYFTIGSSTAVVPEPASIALWSILGLGLAGFAYRRRLARK